MQKSTPQRTVLYDWDYFAEGIFDTNYEAIALAIVETYRPQSVLDAGCGPGKLSRAMARLGVRVMAVDGYSAPDFGDSGVRFHRVDLNDAGALTAALRGETFDLAICVEVAEHLSPTSGSPLVDELSRAAPVIVFSAAVPGQGGQGHIHLRPRDYWHREFATRGYLCADRIRGRLRVESGVAPWYVYNVIDYVRAGHPLEPMAPEVIERLLASESHVTSEVFRRGDQLAGLTARMRQFPINWALAMRTTLKRLMRR
jgi:SAM-dependent methyltransferase